MPRPGACSQPRDAAADGDRRRSPSRRTSAPTAGRRPPRSCGASGDRRPAQALFREMDFSSCSTRRASSSRSASASRDGALDPSCYDLLASEARLASFLAIAKGDVPADHWFRLGRALTPVGRGSALISWSGSMFEYLMPALVMRAPAGSLLDQTYRLVVRAPDRVRRRARRAVGHLGIGVQRPRPRADLPVLELRRARPRAEARPERGPRHRPLRHGAGGDGRSRGGGRATSRACATRRRARPLRLLRGARLHAARAARGRDGRRSCAPTWRTTRA